MIYQIEKQLIERNTSQNHFSIEVLTGQIDVENIVVDYEMLANRCKTGCSVYNTKYSCPPYSPDFNLLKKDYKFMVVNLLKVDMNEYKKVFHSVRMVNTVEKSLQKKLIDRIVSNDEYVLENGSCRLCKKCTKIYDKPCNHPEKMRFSLEATGINVNELCKSVFDFELVWHKDGKSPEYLCVVAGILTHDPETTKEKIINAYSNYKE
ncbi:MAG: DUF2284 domain-containing protein [Vampirovibrionia bacterium]